MTNICWHAYLCTLVIMLCINMHTSSKICLKCTLVYWAVLWLLSFTFEWTPANFGALFFAASRRLPAPAPETDGRTDSDSGWGWGVTALGKLSVSQHIGTSVPGTPSPLALGARAGCTIVTPVTLNVNINSNSLQLRWHAHSLLHGWVDTPRNIAVTGRRGISARSSRLAPIWVFLSLFGTAFSPAKKRWNQNQAISAKLIHV